MPNYALSVEYDGSCFFGWQKQTSLKSVQESLESALNIILHKNPHSKLCVAGRTDTGVHALGMICNFKTEFPIPNDYKLIHSVNALSDLGVNARSITEVPDDFHARFSCTAREYVYKIYYSKHESVLHRKSAYWLKHHIDWNRIQEQIPYLLGERDFRSFTKAKSMKGKRAIRNIQEIKVEQDPQVKELYQIRVKANGFMHNMVRITVGTLLDIGKGRWERRSIESILEEEDRTQAGMTLPPHGLYFVRAYYQEFPQIDALYEPVFP